MLGRVFAAPPKGGLDGAAASLSGATAAKSPSGQPSDFSLILFAFEAHRELVEIRPQIADQAAQAVERKIPVVFVALD